MALGATIYKANIDISDVDRGYYGSHLCTLARHPSETEERLAIRMLVFCLYVGETDMRLEFGRGLSTEGEPALWEIDDTGAIARWIDVGVPISNRFEKRLVAVMKKSSLPTVKTESSLGGSSIALTCAKSISSRWLCSKMRKLLKCYRL